MCAKRDSLLFQTAACFTLSNPKTQSMSIMPEMNRVLVQFFLKYRRAAAAKTDKQTECRKK